MKRELDWTNVGVGVSQLLPVLVMGLTSQPGMTLIYEQPELHLHPRLQSLLAEFFVALTAGFLGEDHLFPLNNLYGYVCNLLSSNPNLIVNVTTKISYVLMIISSLLVVNVLWRDRQKLLIFFQFWHFWERKKTQKPHFFSRLRRV